MNKSNQSYARRGGAHHCRVSHTAALNRKSFPYPLPSEYRATPCTSTAYAGHSNLHFVIVEHSSAKAICVQWNVVIEEHSSVRRARERIDLI